MKFTDEEKLVIEQALAVIDVCIEREMELIAAINLINAITHSLHFLPDYPNVQSSSKQVRNLLNDLEKKWKND